MLAELLTRHAGDLPGAVALVARGEQVEAAAVGSADAGEPRRWPGIRCSASGR
ncbi:hypothetical protein [Amycolatopsis nalaikhensis]|uniref:Uncharacterized protein n=1 Tax=Amycolatopsis nalaikhensis TaxID=715472 RepID=A0ABY8XMP8_9PSEU|nr:hypothetical protein [Amycolatopsis sp. 2-2]WIV56881.1 hypothetical protein QP939_50355 [Amycolatopsis sp. 2-2]